jgi:hypothetical protein
LSASRTDTDACNGRRRAPMVRLDYTGMAPLTSVLGRGAPTAGNLNGRQLFRALRPTAAVPLSASLWRPGDCCRGPLRADSSGPGRIAGPMIHLQHIFHVRHERRVGRNLSLRRRGRSDEVLVQMGFDNVFLRPPNRVVAGARDNAALHDLVFQQLRRPPCPSFGTVAKIKNFAIMAAPPVNARRQAPRRERRKHLAAAR